MAASITPKSKARQITSISVGFGEVPVVHVDGRQGWGLPGQAVTYCRDEAYRLAQRLDQLIRGNTDQPHKVL